MESEEKVYFIPGDIVKIRHCLDNVPVMLVLEKVTNRIFIPNLKNEPVEKFVGIKCGWYTSNQEWTSAVFSTKDLIKVEEVN